MGPGADNRRRTDNRKRNNGECFVNGGRIKNEKHRDPGSRPVLKADKRKRSIVFDYTKVEMQLRGSYVKSLSWRIKERSKSVQRCVLKCNKSGRKQPGGSNFVRQFHNSGRFVMEALVIILSFLGDGHQKEECHNREINRDEYPFRGPVFPFR
ncbi:hypothetical protein GEV33_004595 [Tenebrio molitor]|uniref:Uncharacterized protein n=1 Tax=Tenebrio molitor TaxID=7067 RepID=A0A8J6LMH9_TENMO|nr:hypothetical protein GEV33_004595 [Tenebrio molitor]